METAKKILYLVVHKQWFDMIRAGIKKDEYRDITAYWCRRLLKDWPYGSIEDFKEFDAVEFRNGYSKYCDKFLIECKGISTGKGQSEWGAIGDIIYFKISLGNILQ